MKYSYFTYKMETTDGSIWIAESFSLKGCVGQGTSVEAAVLELESNEKEWLKTAKKVGLEIPREESSNYSGKISLRLEPSEHRKAAIKARREGISLNQYLCDAIVARNAVL